MAKTCDNKSAGVLVWSDGKLLMIERKKYNFGFAVPAGHQDGEDAETAARRELFEEMGINAPKLKKVVAKTLQNPCSYGKYHDWTIFEAGKWSGEPRMEPTEVKRYLWATAGEIQDMVRRLEEFAHSQNIPLEENSLPLIVAATNQIDSWRQNPGLEPPMYFLFKGAGII